MKAQRPLSRLLESPTDEARIARVWGRIRAQRDQRRRARWTLALGLGLTAAAALGLWAWRDAEPSVAALRTASGELPAQMEASEAPRTVTMSDGSSVRLDPGARLETIQNDDGRFATLLSRGTARFSVTPGGPRHWIVESGLATVEVIGTVFTVARSEEGVRVTVERGVVLVRGERVPDRVARLTHGQTIFVRRDSTRPMARAPAPTADAPRAAPDRTADAHERNAAAPRAEARSVASEAAGPTPDVAPTGELAPTPRAPGGASSNHGLVEATARPTEPSPPRPTAPEGGAEIDRWLEQADEARRAGDTPTAVQLLRQVAERGTGPRAALAAFTLGRLEMDEQGRPTAARAAFQRALALGLPERLAQQARVRIAEIDEAEDP